jgi:hypothetical protein
LVEILLIEMPDAQQQEDWLFNYFYEFNSLFMYQLGKLNDFKNNINDFGLAAGTGGKWNIREDYNQNIIDNRSKL